MACPGLLQQSGCGEEHEYTRIGTVEKHNAINYHAVREAAAAGVLQVHKDDTQTNLADLFTKVLSADCRRELLGSIVYNL
jgi:hypothetical protein